MMPKRKRTRAVGTFLDRTKTRANERENIACQKAQSIQTRQGKEQEAEDEDEDEDKDKDKDEDKVEQEKGKSREWR